ncbi:MAG: hypothetical protein KBS41_05375 [Oscillospiraceae bacterium]|nr:hypothetical protein [Candidatus Equicaccousia limihippi]
MLILTAVLIGCLLCAAGAVVFENGHNCCGEDCPICALINLCEGVIKTAGLIALLRLFACFISRRISFVKTFSGFCHSFSPVYFKVKLSD